MFFLSLKPFVFANRNAARRRGNKQKRSLAGFKIETLEARQMLSITSLTAETITPYENAVFTGTVAQFTGTPGDSFSASIDWGDGHKSAGSVDTVSAGNYSVSGSNTYAEDGPTNFTVVVMDSTDGSSLSDFTTANVQENAFDLTAGPTINTTEGTALTGFQAALFQDPGSPDLATDFEATIAWGDGTVTSGTVTGSGGHFTVTGDHTYTDELSASYSVTVSEPDANFTFGPVVSSVTVAEADTLTPKFITTGSVPEGALLGGAAAAFNDSGYPTNDPADFSGTFDWGDGTTFTTGAGNVSITGDGAGHFTLSVSAHAYADEGVYAAVATLRDNAPGTAADSQTGTLTVTEADALTPSPTPITVTGTEGAAVSGTVAIFSNAGYPNNSASDFSANIDWGDGTVDLGVTATGGSGADLTVSGSHTYADDGSYAITTTIIEDVPGTAAATATSTASIAEADLTVSPPPAAVAFTEGSSSSGVFAIISDPGSNDPATRFSANIAWGDGTVSSGTLTGSAGSYTVSGSHAYADEGVYTVTVTASENGAAPAATATFTVSVDEGDAGNLIAATITPTEGQAFSGAVASFTDEGNPLQVAGDWTASIDWGDGTSTTAGTVTGPTGGPFTINGNHTYADEGTFAVIATFSDNAPSALTGISISSTAVVSDADALTAPTAAVSVSATEGTTFSSSALATFTNSYTGSVPADFNATIDWGDGTQSTGTVTGSGGVFAVGGSHLYLDEMTATPVSIVLSENAPGTASATASGTVTVQDASLTAMSTSLTATAGISFTATVASFTDANPNATITDFSTLSAATIDWGDGTSSVGTVVSSGNAFNVIGTHTYLAAGTPAITVHIADEGGSTADATSTASVTAVVDLTVTKSDDHGGNSAMSKSGSVVAGTGLSYTIVVSNAGPSEAFGATITDSVPLGFQVLSSTPTVSGGAVITASSGSGGNLIDTVNLPSGSSITYVVTGTVASSVSGMLANVVFATLAAGTVNTGDTTATDSDIVTVQGGVSVTKSDNKGGNSATGATGSAVAGVGITYTIVVSNVGPSDVTGAALNDILPAGFTPAAFTATATGGATGYTATGSGNISNTVNLPAGSTIIYVLTGTISPDASGTMSNTVKLTLPPAVANSGNLSATDVDQLTVRGPLAGVPGDGTIQTFVQNLYRELLGREADTAGSSFWVAYLAANNNAAGRQTVVEAFLNSAEYKAHYITTLYRVFLGRTPEPAAVQFWAAQMGQPGTPGLHNGPADESNILSRIVGSDEFYAKAGGTPAAFVRAVYRDLLGRPGDANGVAGWVAILNAQPQRRDLIVRSFVSSPELAHKLLNSFFPALGGTPANPLPAPGSSAAAGAYDLAVITGDGWENLYLEGAALVAVPGGGDAYFNELAAGASWDDVQLQILSSSQFYNNPLRPTTT